MFIPPPILLLGAIFISYLLSFVPGPLISTPFHLLGWGFIGVGLGLFVWTIQLFQKHKTTLEPRGKPSALITIGPYRLSRNPIYLGFLLVSIGTALLFAKILAFVGPLLFFYFVTTFVIPFEEETLTSIFGEDYRNFSKRIRRWI